MSVLTKDEILKRIKDKNLAFDPVLDQFQFQAHSVDLRIGYKFLVYKDWNLTKEGRVALQFDYGKTNEHFEVIELKDGQYFEILPQENVVVSTLEKVKIPNDLMAVLYPRSSVNRRGLSVDLSGIIDAGYEGSLIVPIRNNTGNQVVRIYPGERFCQLVFSMLTTPVKPRTSRYAKRDVTAGVLKEINHSENDLIKSGGLKKLKKLYPAK